jgi:hypothetical protein
MLDRLQKADQETIEFIKLIKQTLFSLGIRTSEERAWEVFKSLNKLPFQVLIDKNKEEGIKYQGQGVHLSSKHANQRLVIKDVGQWEIKAVSARKGMARKAVVKFTPSEDIKKLALEVEVKE